MTRTTEQLHIDGVNEELTDILTTATEQQLTPASILGGIIAGNNIVSEYMESYSDTDNLLYDLSQEHERLISVYPNISNNTIAFINNMSGETIDRYMTTLRFVDYSLNTDLFGPVYKNTLGKYIKINHFQEDINNMLPARPNQRWKTTEETILDVFGRDLTKLSLRGDLSEIVGRDEEVQRMIQILTRQTKSNPILLGKAGVGKTALVEKLANILMRKEVPHSLVGWKLIELNMAKLLSDKDIETTMMEIVETAYREQAILFIDEVHLINNNNGKITNLLKPAMARGHLKLIGATTHDEYKTFEKDEAIQRRFQSIIVDEPSQTMVYEILKTKASEAQKFHNVLIPKETLLKAIVLSNRYIPDRQQPDKAIDLIEEASARLRATLESRPQVIVDLQRKIADIFIEIEMISVGSDNVSERDQKKIDSMTKEMNTMTEELDKLNSTFEDQHQLLINVIATKEQLATLKQRRDKEVHLGNFEAATSIDIKDIPGLERSIQEQENDLIEMASTVDENLIQNVVVPVMVERVIETITGIPVSAQNEEDIQKYANIDKVLKSEVHGQDRPIDMMSMAIKRSKAGLADASRPLGSFLCLGPTGVGKTYLAQKLTEFMFDTDKVMKRFDMSEYMESHSVSRLFGSPPGYVGHDEGGQLTEVIRRNPYSVILFDEIEKAHPKVFNALLQILDAGRMTDGKGNEINFKNTVIVMTSNIGSDIIRAGLEKNTNSEVIEMAMIQELGNHFKPEFLNRFDAKLMFNALEFDSVVKITKSELKKLAVRLADNNGLDLYWHPNVAEVITEESYDIMNGARPIKRFINDRIVSLLTDKIMSNDINPQVDDKVYLATFNGNFDIFSVDNEMLQTLRDAEISVKKKKKKKKKKGVILTPAGEEIDLGSEDDDLSTELGD